MTRYIIEKYDGTKPYMHPNGELATPEKIKQRFPASEVFTHIVETDEQGQVMLAFQNLAAVRTQMEIDPSLAEEEAMAKIEELRNTPQPEPGPTPEERVAAALEFQNILNMEG